MLQPGRGAGEMRGCETAFRQLLIFPEPACSTDQKVLLPNNASFHHPQTPKTSISVITILQLKKMGSVQLTRLCLRGTSQTVF